MAPMIEPMRHIVTRVEIVQQAVQQAGAEGVATTGWVLDFIGLGHADIPFPVPGLDERPLVSAGYDQCFYLLRNGFPILARALLE